MGRGVLRTAFALSLASAPFFPAGEARRQLQEAGGTPGTCIETHVISGFSFEDNQDQNSLQVSVTLVEPHLW